MLASFLDQNLGGLTSYIGYQSAIRIAIFVFPAVSWESEKTPGSHFVEEFIFSYRLRMPLE
ncbi:MAG: hypothetical protein NTX50_19955 [Candidatus Sumerlaeota bacterium]|nr:hypothetical protein [Candidatus Sumerlaeota bacterium]